MFEIHLKSVMASPRAEGVGAHWIGVKEDARRTEGRDPSKGGGGRCTLRTSEDKVCRNNDQYWFMG